MATVAKSPRSTPITLAADSAGPFDLSFRLFDDDGIQVYVNNIQRTDWTLSSNYVDGYDDNATITFNASLSSGDVIIIDSSLTPGRADDYTDGPNLTYLQNIELGRIWAALADIKRDVNRSAKFFGAVSPLALEAGRMVVVNGAGDDLALGAIAAEIPAAEGHAQKAKQWAEEDEDVEVETGEYSAKHHSAKSAGFAATSAGWATTAATSAAEAATSAASINPTQVVVVNGDRTIVVGDSNAILRPDARRILTLPSPAGFFNGFSFRVDAPFGAAVAADVGVSLTFVGRGTVGSIEVLPNQVLTVFTDGTEYFAYVSSDPLFEVVYVDPNLASVPFVDVAVPYGKRAGRFWYNRFEPTVENDYLAARVGSGGVVSTAGAYFMQPADMSYDHFILGHQTEVSATSNTVSWGDGVLYGFHDPNFSPHCRVVRGGVAASATTDIFDTIGGKMPGNAATAADTIRFFSSSGNIKELYLHIDWA